MAPSSPKPSPMDAKQVEPGNRIALLCGDYDPAHIGYFRALEALVGRKGIDEVWVAPFYSDRTGSEHIQSMCTTLATEASTATKKLVGCCTVALSKRYRSPDEIRVWCQHAYPDVMFTIARLDGTGEIAVLYANEKLDASSKAELVTVPYLPPPKDLRERIAAGEDMARHFCSSVWHYIQHFRLYR